MNFTNTFIYKAINEPRRMSRMIMLSNSKHLAASMLLAFSLQWAGASSLEDVSAVTNQTELAQIAMEATDREVRDDAFRKITDQEILAKIVLESKIEMHRAIAIGIKLKDEKLIEKIAIEAKEPCYRSMAVSCLTNETVLTRIALTESDERLRSKICIKLTKQSSLAKIATESKDADLRRQAFERLKKETLFEEGGEWANPDFAKKGIRQTLLAKIVTEERDPFIRIRALEMLDDQILLKELALEGNTEVYQWMAWNRLTDQNLKAELVIRNPDAEVRKMALHGLTNQVLLLKVVDESQDQSLRHLVVRCHLNDPHVLTKLFFDEKYSDLWASAIDSLHDQPLRAQIALEHKDWCIRHIASLGLGDSACQEKVGLLSKDKNVLESVIGRMSDHTRLRKLSFEAADASMRLAAMQKSGRKSWADIFNEAVAEGALPDRLDEAIAAAELIFKKSESEDCKNVRNTIREFCRNLIRRGDDTHLLAMRKMLWTFSDRALAEDFFFCGHDYLNSIAESWMKAIEYRPRPSSDSTHVKWKSDK